MSMYEADTAGKRLLPFMVQVDGHCKLFRGEPCRDLDAR